MKQFVIFCAFTLWFSNCASKDIPFLKSGDLKKISNKSEKELLYGCFGYTTTQGEFELKKILDDSLYFRSADEKNIFCISVIENRELYHLHDLAGFTLSQSLRTEDKVGFIQNNTTESSINYSLMRLNHHNDHSSSAIYSHEIFNEIDSIKQAELISYLKDNRLNNNSKLYILDGLYSLTFKEQTGRNIHTQIASLKLSRQLLEYNDSLYNVFSKLKPRFDCLDKIKTWMEMDKNKSAIETMLKNFHPIMFMQILNFNPSTVLESKSLCKLKEKALSTILRNAQTGSFYKDLKYIYMNELLIDNNYTVRFLDGVMFKMSIPAYRFMIEKE